MRILARYVAGQFLRPFFYGLALFATLILLGDVLDHLNAFMRTEASIGTILLYLSFQVPYWTVRIVPAATLLATLFCMGRLMRSGEWIAAQATGFSPKELLRPILVCAAGVSIVAFAAQEWILPVCHRNANRMYREDIKGEPPSRRFRFENVDIVTGKGEFLHARVLDIRTGTMEGVVWTRSEGARIAEQRTARGAVWDAAARTWFFREGAHRIFEEGLRTRESEFDRWSSPVATPPSNLEFGRYEPDSKGIFETWRFIQRRRSMGLATHYPETALHMKFSYPLSNVVIAALAIPIALGLGGLGKVLGSVLAMLIGFLFWWLLALSEAFGAAGRLSPFLSAWIPNAVFGATAFWGWRRR